MSRTKTIPYLNNGVVVGVNDRNLIDARFEYDNICMLCRVQYIVARSTVVESGL